MIEGVSIGGDCKGVNWWLLRGCQLVVILRGGVKHRNCGKEIGPIRARVKDLRLLTLCPLSKMSVNIPS